jgi:hypothetical protein
MGCLPDLSASNFTHFICCSLQVGRVIYAVKDLQPNNTQDLWLPVKPLLKQDKVRGSCTAAVHICLWCDSAADTRHVVCSQSLMYASYCSQAARWVHSSPYGCNMLVCMQRPPEEASYCTYMSS